MGFEHMTKKNEGDNNPNEIGSKLSRDYSIEAQYIYDERMEGKEKAYMKEVFI